jgi:urease accessory protein
MNLHRIAPGLAASVLAVTSTAALAHPGHGAAAQGFVAGLLHPLSGADHMLAMFVVGLWAALALPAGRRLFAPLAFVGAMLAAAVPASLGLMPLTAGTLEPMLAGSVMVMGLLLAGGARVAAPLGLALVVLAGALHGLAHWLEAAGGVAAYVAGFVASTLALHGVGIAAGPRLAVLHRAAGAAVGLAGLAMLLARV